MIDLVIPWNFNCWPKEKQIQHYLAIGWRIQPVYPPLHPKSELVTSPGKQPRFSLEKRLAMTPEEILAHFHNYPDDNVGLIPSIPNIGIDLDDKGDGSSLTFFLSRYPLLNDGPRVRSPQGPHLHPICHDLPSGIKKITTLDLVPGLNAELFADPSGNLVLPPSVHINGTNYCWEQTANNEKLPVWSWAELQRIFKFHVNGAAEHRDPRWKQRYRGDLKTLNLIGLCKKLGIYGQLLAADEYKHSIQCPWESEHTDKGEPWRPERSDTAIFVNPGQIPSFKCLHAHCGDRHIEQLLEWAESRQAGIVDAFCTRRYWHDSFEKEPEVEQECPYPEVDWDAIPKNDDSGPKFVQEAIYPQDSILADYMDVANEVCEGASCWSLATILTVVAALLARRVYYPRTDKNVYLNVFNFIVGLPGHRKTTTLRLGEKIAYHCLPASAFLPARCSVEALFDEYYEGAGGRPDKLWLVEEANVVMSTWTKTQYGECVAAEMLRLYDACRLIEAFKGNKGGSKSAKSRREVPETSTSALFSGTFTTATIPVAHVKEGLARRFQFYVSEIPQRVIIWPETLTLKKLFNLFKPLLALKGELSFLSDKAAYDFWADYQHKNRKLLAEIRRDDDALGARLSTAPDNLLKAAGHFEVCRAVKKGATSISRVSLESLELAARHVDENLRAAAFLDKHGKQKSIREQAEVTLSIIRGDFKAQRPNTIYVTRSDLTRKFCHNRRMGALTTDELYYDILPELMRQGEAVQVLKQGKFEVYAFRAQPFTEPPEPSSAMQATATVEANSPSSPNSPGPFNHTSNNTDACVRVHMESQNSPNSTGGTYIVDLKAGLETGVTTPARDILNGPGENRENVENAPQNAQYSDDYCLICNNSEVEEVWYELNETDAPLALDIETYGDHISEALQPNRGEIRLISVALENVNPVLFDVRTLGKECPDWEKLFSNRELISHSAQFELRWLAAKLGVYPTKIFCTFAAARLLSCGDRNLRNDLGSVLERHLNVHLEKTYGASDWGALMLTDGQLRYAADDVRHLHQLRVQLGLELAQAKLTKIFELEMALLPVTVAIEQAGFAVDRQKLEAIRDSANASAREGPLRALKEKFGFVNFDSPEQLLGKFKSIGVELPDTTEDTLVTCEHPAAKLVLEYRSLEMQRRQAESYLAEVGLEGRIHAEFLPLGTDTGRFSGRNPNLQNINRGRLRDAFIASDPDHRLVIADYSQIELRAAAYLAQDDKMLESLREGRDLHADTAAVVLRKKPGDITKDDRQLAKALNFGLLYGLGGKGLCFYAQTSYGIKLSVQKANSVRNRFFEYYAGLAAWHRKAWANISSITEGRTLLGRRRLLGPEPKDWHRFQLQTNFPTTGSCADGLKLAMVRLARELPPEAKIVATVHDELIVDCPESIAQEVEKLMNTVMVEEMAKIFPDLPIKVDAKICNRWSEK
jgi:DNA polymerase-1